MTIAVYRNDLPDNVVFKDVVAVDCETLGLNPLRDRLCVVQLSAGDGTAHLVQFDGSCYEAPNLKAQLSNPQLLKVFHFARFDLAALQHWLGLWAMPVFCTKIASKLTRTYTSKHGLKDVVKELLEIQISKEEQSSDWGAETLTKAQQNYAAADVLHLHELHRILTERLKREGREELALRTFQYLPVRAELDLLGWGDVDIFAHKG